jgi:hypothetical protein
VVAVARWADVAMLLLIVAAFIAMIVLCSKVFASALRTLFAAEKKMSEMMEVSAATATSYAQGKQLIVEASNEGRQLKRKIISTFTFAFLSLLLRTVMTLIYALASTGQVPLPELDFELRICSNICALEQLRQLRGQPLRRVQERVQQRPRLAHILPLLPNARSARIIPRHHDGGAVGHEWRRRYRGPYRGAEADAERRDLSWKRVEINQGV